MTDKHTLVDEYLIRKGGYFYRPNSQGYTSSPLEAGIYTLDQAIKETHPNGPDGDRDGLTYHHRSDFPEIVEATNMATRITALEAEKAELVGRLVEAVEFIELFAEAEFPKTLDHFRATLAKARQSEGEGKE